MIEKDYALVCIKNGMLGMKLTDSESRMQDIQRVWIPVSLFLIYI